LGPFLKGDDTSGIYDPVWGIAYKRRVSSHKEFGPEGTEALVGVGGKGGWESHG